LVSQYLLVLAVRAKTGCNFGPASTNVTNSSWSARPHENSLKFM